MIVDKPRRVLSIFMLVMINISMMASLRTLPLVAELGLSAVFFFLVVGLTFLLPCALVSAELATGWPKSGGIYIWVREALGERWGFFAIWMQWVHNVAWYPVIMSFVGATLAYLFAPALASSKWYIFSVILIGYWGMTWLNYLGIKTSGWVSTVGVIVGTIAPGVLIIVLGIMWLISGNPSHIPFTWESSIPDLSQMGNLVFLAGLFLAFAGLEVPAGYAGNVKNPQKNFPKAIVLSAVITFALFMLGSLAIGVVIPKSQISLVSGVIETFEVFFNYYHLGWFLPFMVFLLVIGAIAEVNSWIIGPVQGLHATAIHGSLPPILQKVNQQGVPTALLLVQALIVTATSFAFLFMPSVSSAFWILTALSAQSYLIMYILMFLAALVLRYSKPKVPRPYRVPYHYHGIWIACTLGIVACLFAILLGFVPPTQLKITDLVGYVLFLSISLFLMCIVPLILYQIRKPQWKYIEKNHD